MIYCNIGLYKEVLTFVDQCTTGCEVHTNFADESVCLMAGNIWNQMKLLTLDGIVGSIVRVYGVTTKLFTAGGLTH
jgi:hypothetical protein